MKINILVCNYNNSNLGDNVIDISTKYLIRKAMSELGITDYQIITYDSLLKEKALFRYVDLIIFSGGGIIKYDDEKMVERVIGILDEAKKFRIPTMFNGVGVEGYGSEDNGTYRRLRKRLRYSCVKMISVRDDVDGLIQGYFGGEVPKSAEVVKVADPAVWASEAMGIHKAPDCREIGIGVIRAEVFSKNGWEEVTEEKLIHFYAELIKMLNQNGIKWKLFTNGGRGDFWLAKKVLQAAGYEVDDSEHLSVPDTAEELVQIISGFKAVVASRLHANIIAYSLGIPSIGVVWNRKINFWMNNIGYPERCADVVRDNAVDVLDKLNHAMAEGIVKQPDFINSVYLELKRFLEKNAGRICRIKEKDIKRKTIVAVGMGAYQDLRDGGVLSKTASRRIKNFYDLGDAAVAGRIDLEKMDEENRKKYFFVIFDTKTYAEYAEILGKKGLKAGINYCSAYRYDSYDYRALELFKERDWSAGIFWKNGTQDEGDFFDVLDRQYAAGYRKYALKVLLENEDYLIIFKNKNGKVKKIELQTLWTFVEKHRDIEIAFYTNKLETQFISGFLGNIRDCVRKYRIPVTIIDYSLEKLQIAMNGNVKCQVVYGLTQEDRSDLQTALKRCEEARVESIVVDRKFYLENREIIDFHTKVKRIFFKIRHYAQLLDMEECDAGFIAEDIDLEILRAL